MGNKIDRDELQSLLPWATPLRREMIEATLKHGTMAAGANAIGISVMTLRSAISKLRKSAARRGWDPVAKLQETIAPGFHVKGRSTMRAKNPLTGEWEVRAEWIKTKADDDERMRLLMEAIQDFASDYDGFARPVARVPARGKRRLDPKLLNILPIGDPHFGMLSWPAETGQRFNLEIASRNIKIAMDELFSIAPPAETCLIINAGDFFHSDNSVSTTTRGTQVDVDSRRSKMLVVGVESMVYAVDRALRYHDRVVVHSEAGNHDKNTAAVLTLYLSAWFRNEPRVTINIDPTAYHYYQHGKVLIASTHGDKSKHLSLPTIMACDRPEQWGSSKFRHWYVGHVHHKSVLELPGCTVETLNTLAATDAWHYESGYRSLRKLQLDTWHEDYGYKTQRVVSIDEIQDLGGE